MKTIIFDFDGTLVDSLDVLIEAARSLGQEYGIPADTDVAAMRTKSPLHILRKELRWSWVKIGRFIRAVRPVVYAGTKRLPIRPGMKRVVEELKKRYEVGILTSNSREVVEAVLRNEGMSVAFVHGGSSLFGKHRAIRSLLKQRGLAERDVLYIGDEIRDIEACRKAGVRVCAVTWGTNSKRSLEMAKPDFLVDRPEQLKKIVSSL